ncbi:MAG: hypothetical protein GX996_10260 [Firmicutes bacterium]|nr:hypothetical protein [Bacillota bacterium]
MRKFIRDQTIELIDTVNEGVKYTKNVDSRNSIPVLYDCYIAMKSIFKVLKTSLSAERLIFYAQIIDNIMGLLEQIIKVPSNVELRQNPITEIDYMLAILKKELMSEKEVKLEILFLPYKSSMWDSLESIWRAAKDDPSCDCYVVPIPYYDRKP